MKIIIEGEPKEIAELLSALQEQKRDADFKEKSKSGVTKVIGYTYTPSYPCKCCGKANEMRYEGTH